MKKFALCFAVLCAYVGLQAAGGWTVPTHGLTVKVSHGPTMPPDPWEP